MNKLYERFLIYTAVAILCTTVATVVGSSAGVWTMVQIIAVVELIYWIARPLGASPDNSLEA